MFGIKIPFYSDVIGRQLLRLSTWLKICCFSISSIIVATNIWLWWKTSDMQWWRFSSVLAGIADGTFSLWASFPWTSAAVRLLPRTRNVSIRSSNSWSPLSVFASTHDRWPSLSFTDVVLAKITLERFLCSPTTWPWASRTWIGCAWSPPRTMWPIGWSAEPCSWPGTRCSSWTRPGWSRDSWTRQARLAKEINPTRR